MIKIATGAYSSLAKLQCDKCGAELPQTLAVRDTEPFATTAQREQLRERAHYAGWTLVLGAARAGGRDICPHCLKQPPEG
jgi:ribosomal protein S26